MGSIDLSKLKPDDYKVVSTPKSTSIDLSTLSPDQYKVVSGSNDNGVDLEALKVGAEKGLTLGTRPFIAGIGGGIGAGSVALENKGSLSDFLKSLPNAGKEFARGFGEEKQAAIDEQNRLSERSPKSFLAGELGGGALVPLPGLGKLSALKKSAATGALIGAGNALGEAKTPLQGAVDTAVGAGTGALTHGAISGIKELANTEVVQNLASKGGELLSNIGNKIKGGILKTAEALTGVPDKEIETYATQYDKVKELIDKSGGNVPHAAEIVKENLQNSIKSTKNNLNQQIDSALSNASKDKIIDISPIIDSLEQYKERINPALNPEHIDDINNVINRVKNASTSGKVNVQELQQIKKFLGSIGEFNTSPVGFQVGTEGANAAGRAFVKAKNIMDTYGPEEIKNANRQLFQLHRIEERMNKNLIVPGKSDAALMAVGAGAKNKEALALQRLGQITGKDFVNEAKVLSATNRFTNPGLSPAYTTGKSLIPGGIGASIGAAVAGAPGAAIGGWAGTLIASPAGLKLAIDTGRISGRAITAVADKFGINPENINQVYQVLQSPEAQQLLIKATAGPVARRLIKSQFNQNGGL